MSKIEWTDETWNPVTGCTKVSQGCKNCYAERMYERFNGHGSFKNVQCHEDRLTMPMRWKKPSMVFVNSMSDLFHEDVPFEFIDAVFRVMRDVNQHIYQVLTKRPKRMLEFYQWKKEQFNLVWQSPVNIWIGVSVEDQQTANERIPLLVKIPAAVKFLSCEPLLGPINLMQELTKDGYTGWLLSTEELRTFTDQFPIIKNVIQYPQQLFHWVIVGGESGHGARPLHPDWAMNLKDQCKVAGVPFFFKQWGEYRPVGLLTEVTTTGSGRIIDGYYFERCGKKSAGRLLDGVLYNEFPNGSRGTR